MHAEETVNMSRLEATERALERTASESSTHVVLLLYLWQSRC